MAKKVALPPMDEDMKKRIFRAAHTTWQALAPELPIPRNGMPRNEVIDVVLDANYMEVQSNDKDACAELRKLTFAQQTELLKETFTAKRYE